MKLTEDIKVAHLIGYEVVRHVVTTNRGVGSGKWEKTDQSAERGRGRGRWKERKDKIRIRTTKSVK